MTTDPLIILTLITGVVGILIQVWQRYDDAKQGKNQTKLQYMQHGLDKRQADSNIEQQQADIHLRVTEGLREELSQMTSRYKDMSAEYTEYKKNSTEVLDQIPVMFDEIELYIEKNNGTQESKDLIKAIRKFRRDYCI